MNSWEIFGRFVAAGIGLVLVGFAILHEREEDLVMPYLFALAWGAVLLVWAWP